MITDEYSYTGILFMKWTRTAPWSIWIYRVCQFCPLQVFSGRPSNELTKILKGFGEFFEFDWVRARGGFSQITIEVANLLGSEHCNSIINEIASIFLIFG